MPPVSRRCAADVLPGHRRLRADSDQLWPRLAPVEGRLTSGCRRYAPGVAGLAGGTQAGDRVAFVGCRWRPGGSRFTMPVMGGDRADVGMVVALLGPVEVGLAGGAMTPVAQPRLRVLLGLLGAAGGRLVTAEALVYGVWGEEWSPGREKNLHALVYQLRRRLAAWEPERGGGRLVRAGPGYRLALGPGELDVAVFSELAGRGREAARAGDAAGARELFGQALGLWRGAALADAAPLCPRLAGEAARLEELRLAVTEERIGSDLALGLERRGGRGAGRAGGRVPAAGAAGRPAYDRAVPVRAARGGAGGLRRCTAGAGRGAGPGSGPGAGRAAGPGAGR